MVKPLECRRCVFERLIHSHVNEVRTDHNRDRLQFDSELLPVARSHSEDMANRGFFSHVTPDGEGPGERYQQYGYDCNVQAGVFRSIRASENIAQSGYRAPIKGNSGVDKYDTPPQLAHGIVDGWMNSPGHRENMLKTIWSIEAIGMATTIKSGHIHIFVTQNFC